MSAGDRTTSGGAAPPLIRVQRNTIREGARDALRDLIIGGNVDVTKPLRQDELADRLGISRTPLREALHALASEGLVTIDPHRGAMVTQPSVQQLRDLYEIREQLEVLAGRKVVEATSAEHLTAVRTLHERMGGLSDPVEWADLNQEFHATLYSCCPNRELISMIGGLGARAKFYVRILVSTRPPAIAAYRDHGEMLAALEQRDPEAMERAVRRHLQGTAATVASRLGSDEGK